MSIPLNDEQQRAIAFDDNTWVSAGAGSGKTRTLVELYIKLLSGPDPAPERLVAITFTEKAAAEMKDRIREAIDDQAQAATTDAQAERWTSLRRELARAPISTIHSFCASILRDYPAMARVDPSFSVLEQREADGHLTRALETVILGGVQAQDPQVTRLVDLYGLTAGEFGGSGLMQSVKGLYAEMVQAGLTIADCRDRIPRPDPMLAPQTQALTSAVNDLVRRALDGSAKQKAEITVLLPRWSQAKERAAVLSAQTPADGLAWIARLREAFKGKNALKRMTDWATIKELMDELDSRLSEHLSVPVLGELLTLVERVEQGYVTAKNRVSGLDFEDLQVKARNLLRDQPTLRQLYQEKWDVLMVDEYQDTNALQDSLVSLIVKDDAGVAARKLFVVGDPKQSIYGFRGADVSVFMGWKSVLPTVCHLQSNYRSVPAIVDFVNQFFSDYVLAGQSSASWEIRFTPDDAMRAERTGPGTVQMLCVERGDDELTDDARSREASLLADHIWQAVMGPSPARVGLPGDESTRPATFGDCAMLFRVTSSIKIYEHELRRRNIPYYVVKGQGFFECQEIKDVVNVLTWLDDTAQHIALAGFLRSPMVGLSDNALLQLASAGYFTEGTRTPLADAEEEAAFARGQAWLVEWQELRDRLAPSELVERIVRSTGYLAAIVPLFQGAQKVANVRKLVDLARDYEEKGPYNFRGFVRYLTTLVEERAREPEYPVWAERADVVRLMTVHQSKGLQFPLVYVPQMSRDNRGVAESLMFHADRGVVAKVRVDKYHLWLKPPDFAAVEAEKKSRELEESRRLLYVAVTRAADHLIMSGEFGSRQARENTWAGWLRSYVGPAHIDLNVSDVYRGVLLWRRPDIPPAPIREVASPTLTPLDLGASRGTVFTPPPPQVLLLTARELAEYLVCARRHYYSSVLSLEEAPPRQRVPAAGTLRAEQRGQVVHRVLEDIDFAAGPAEVGHILRRLVGGDAPELARLGKDLTAFLGSPTGQALRTARQVSREVPLYLTLQDVDGWTLQVSGVADIIYEDADGVWHVLDYKQTRLGRGRLPLYTYQLKLYAAALIEALDLPEVHIGLRFLEDRKSPPGDTVVTRAEARQLQAQAVRAGRQLGGSSRLLSEEAWPKVNQEQKCHDLECGFRWRCGRLPVSREQLEFSLDL